MYIQSKYFLKINWILVPLQHSVGLPVGYMVEWVSRSGCKVLGLMFREVCGWFLWFLGFCGFCGVWRVGEWFILKLRLKQGKYISKSHFCRLLTKSGRIKNWQTGPMHNLLWIHLSCINYWKTGWLIYLIKRLCKG